MTIFLTGKFNSIGTAEGLFNASVSPIKELKLLLHSATKNWVILSEVSSLFLFYFRRIFCIPPLIYLFLQILIEEDKNRR